MATARKRTTGTPAVFVIDGARTPFLKARTGPGPFRASDLAVHGAQPLLARQPFTPDELDEVVVGCIGSSPDEVNIGRLIALRLGCGDRVPGWTVQRNCASGMQAIDSAARSIVTGRAQLVLAGGVGERLKPLTQDRAKPAVPFGGIYRIVDFTLNNCINSGPSTPSGNPG